MALVARQRKKTSRKISAVLLEPCLFFANKNIHELFLIGWLMMGKSSAFVVGSQSVSMDESRAIGVPLGSRIYRLGGCVGERYSGKRFLRKPHRREGV